jgi:hypothetical protein
MHQSAERPEHTGKSSSSLYMKLAFPYQLCFLLARDESADASDLLPTSPRFTDILRALGCAVPTITPTNYVLVRTPCVPHDGRPLPHRTMFGTPPSTASPPRGACPTCRARRPPAVALQSAVRVRSAVIRVAAKPRTGKQGSAWRTKGRHRVRAAPPRASPWSWGSGKQTGG